MKKSTITKILLGAMVGLMGFGAVSYAQSADTIEKIKQTGQVNLGVRESSGLAYALGNGKYVGFHTEMAERIIDDISAQIGAPITIHYQPITSANRIPLVQNGTIDFECGSTTNNAARAKEAAFAYTTYVEEVRIAVRADSGINSLDDLNGKTIVTTTGTTSVQTLRRKKGNIDFKELQGRDHADSFLQLQSGRAHAFVMDGSIVAANISRSRNPNDFKILDDVLSVEPIACMLRLNDENLLDAINNSIVKQIKDGSLETLYNKWFMEPIPPANTIVGLPLSASTREAWDNPNSLPMEDYAANKVE